jgi:FHA domain-containing protein
MTLTLQAVLLDDRPLSQPITAHFDSRGGTIGRADHNTMALPDPERHVSRLQAEIVASGGGFLIRNVGGANPILVCGRSIGRGESAALAHGDEIRIGGYLLQVDCRDQDAALDVTRGRAMLSAAAPAPPSSPAPQPAPPRPAPPMAAGSNPFADLLGGGPLPGGGTAPAVDPFAATFGTPPGPLPAGPFARAPAPRPPADDPFAGLMPPPAGVAAGSAGLAPAPGPQAPRLPDDFDPFASLPGTLDPFASLPGTLASPPGPAPASDPFADLAPAQAPASIDALFGLGASSQEHQDPLAGFLAGSPPPGAPAQGGISNDPLLALFGDFAAPAAAAPAQADDLPAVNAAYQPPRVVTPAAAPQAPLRPQAPAPAPSSTLRAVPPAADAANAQRLWAALCEGAGIDLPLPAGAGEERMREIGSILRSAVDGALRLIAVRASTKHELRAGVTVIQARGNNPLKFSPDAKTGLEALLQPSMRGFLEGPAAMDDAMHDLVGHSIGTVAGMRAALDGMLDRFAPEALEAKLVGKSMLDNILPINRKAKLWELYLQHYHSIREEAQEDFHSLFGKAFLAAYEQQIEQLKRNDRQR